MEHPEGLIRNRFTTPVCSVLMVGFLTVGDRFLGRAGGAVPQVTMERNRF